MATSWVPIIGAALPVLGAAVKLVTSLVSRSAENRLEGNVKRHSELLAGLPEDADRSRLLHLVDQEVDAVTAYHERRLHRHLDGFALAAVVLVLLVAAAMSYVLWSWSLPNHHAWRVVVRSAAILVGVSGFFFAIVGAFTNLYKDDRDSAKPDGDNAPGQSPAPNTAAGTAPSGTQA